jgi:hypothetical protein
MKAKRCPRCEKDLTTDDFYPVKGRGLCGICKSCTKKQATDYKKKHPERYKKYQRTTVERLIETKKVAKERPCADCGVQYPHYVMDFDHREDKKFTISKMAGRVSQQRLKEEIAKCDVVCANCHRERTHQRKAA